MFPIKKQKAFAAVGHHFPLYDNDIRNIKICWLFPIPDFNTGLCQCGSLKISSKDLQQKEGEKKVEERSPQVSQLQARCRSKVNGLEESQS